MIQVLLRSYPVPNSPWCKSNETVLLSASLSYPHKGNKYFFSTQTDLILHIRKASRKGIIWGIKAYVTNVCLFSWGRPEKTGGKPELASFSTWQHGHLFHSGSLRIYLQCTQQHHSVLCDFRRFALKVANWRN